MNLPQGFLQEFGGTGEPVVLLGDILSGCAAWSRHAERLAASGWRVVGINTLLVAYAAQGKRPPGKWGLAAESRALAIGLHNLGIEKAHLVGWSLGGAIVLDFSMSYPQQVHTLTLVEPQARWVLRRAGRHLESEEAGRKVVQRFAEKAISEEDLEAFLLMAGVVTPGQNPRQSRVWPLAWAHRLALANAYAVATHEDEIARLDRLTMPTLLVRGTESAEVDRGIVDVLLEHIPGAQLAELPGGHTCHLVAFEQCLGALQALLSGHSTERKDGP